MPSTLFTQLIDRLAPAEYSTSKGERWYHITCPACGHDSSRKKYHCSFSDRSWKCFACGAGGSLYDLANRLNLPNPLPMAPRAPRAQAPEQPPSWLQQAPRLVDGYCNDPARFTAWLQYKNIPKMVVIVRKLGVGSLPASKCRHNRLIVPIMVGTEIVGLRGRSLGCDCGKWLAPAGTRPELYPLYGCEMDIRNKIVWLVENPVDALLVTMKTPFVGRASYSTGYWYPHWLESLRGARMVVVCYDQDLTGNGGAERRQEFIKLWYQEHPKAQSIPPSKGVERVNELNAKGINAVLYDWGRSAHKADVGGLLA